MLQSSVIQRERLVVPEATSSRAMCAMGRVPRTRQLSVEVRCCTRDEGKPFATGSKGAGFKPLQAAVVKTAADWSLVWPAFGAATAAAGAIAARLDYRLRMLAEVG